MIKMLNVFLPPKTASIHKMARRWSNDELRKFAHLFDGDVVNVSGWRDIDKQGRTYREYFTNAKNYHITNFRSDMRGIQNAPGEIFLDLEKQLPDNLMEAFDVVFNHTTLEHVFDVHTAVDNLCAMTRDIVILVVPFLQQMHSTYGDYWRFTPQAVTRMFESRGLTIAYLTFNTHKRASVYVFCIATKKPNAWKNAFPFLFSFRDKNESHLTEPYAGCNAFRLPVPLELIQGAGLSTIRKIKKLLRTFLT